MAGFDPSWISAFAGLMASGTAAFLARRATRELDRWRTQQRESKKATVAGEVLVATLRFLTAVSSTTSLAVRRQLAEADPSDEHKQLREASQADWNDIAPISNEFVKAWELAETYLPEEVSKLLDRVWDARSDIRANQITFYSLPLGKGHEFFKKGWGSEPAARLDALRADARKMLCPIAQMAEGTSSARAEARKQLTAEESKKQLPAPTQRSTEGDDP